MTTTAIFDNATFADAIGKASRVAPTKGEAFDKASGILLIVNAATRQAIVRATDLNVTYEQHIEVLEVKGDDAIWRIPSMLLSGIAQNLPMGDGKTIQIIDRNDSWIRMKADRLVTKLAMLSVPDYPTKIFEEFKPDELTPAQVLASKVEQVSWACDAKSQILSGVHINGQKLIGTNQYSIATVPCVVPIEHPVTVPLGNLAQLLKNATDVRCRAVDKRFQLMLDAETRASSNLLEGNYPNVDRVMRDDFTNELQFHRGQFFDTLNRMMVLIRQERLPRLNIEVNGTGLVKMLTFDMEVSDTGRMQDSIDVSADDYSDIFTCNFAPKMILDAISFSKADYMTMHFGHPQGKVHSVAFKDEHGYECHVMPKRD